MISDVLYRRLTKREWMGRKVRSLKDMKNGHALLPAGTIFTITDKFGGFALRSEPCTHCGIQIYIYKVGPWNLELVNEGASNG